MFLGSYQHSLDPKGRVILPAVFREHLQEGLVMTVGHDHCLAVHPTTEWERVLESLNEMPVTGARQRAYGRMLTGLAFAEELDRQGRVTIPPKLREYAQLDKDVAVVGRNTYLELWDAQRWETYREEVIADFAETDEPFGHGIL
jgi:MraZ protein